MLEPIPQNPKAIAIFDFDHTLITGDSFFPFLDFVVGRPRAWSALIKALWDYALERSNPENKNLELRTFVKAKLLKTLLSGKTLSEIEPAVRKASLWQTFNAPIQDALREHHANGHHIVIASGGLDLYLPILLEKIPYHGLICTQIGITADVISGEMVSGNCVREHKAEMVAAYLKKYPAYSESWGYGNYPHDIPMMMLLKHRIIV